MRCTDRPYSQDQGPEVASIFVVLGAPAGGKENDPRSTGVSSSRMPEGDGVKGDR